MAEDGDLISRADSLIHADAGVAGSDRRGNPRHGRRRRSFVASTAERNDTEDRGAAAGDDEDLPLLTEVVLPAVDAADMVPAGSADALRPLLAGDLGRLLEQRLASETPALIALVLDSAGEQLRQGLSAAIAAALGDFLAQRGQLPLPLPTLEERAPPGPDGP
ncbi:MAG: hypothetical protein HT579_21085 [Candidatus Accumulibacter similis]|nr:MAG: hypothetical protein HT579_21085 [Candidatus Accumulibacter similis]